MALENANKEMLSSLGGIVGYISMPPVCKHEDWALLSAIQREIDKRYSVIDKRDLSSFMDHASLKGETTREAIEYIQKEVYELAPHFLNLSANYQKTKFYGFPQYYSKKTLNRDQTHSIEHLFVDGMVPNDKVMDVVVGEREGSISRYNKFLTNICYWLEQFRYINACPYTFTLSTYNRSWEFFRTTNSLSVDPNEYTNDIWDYEHPNDGDIQTKKKWKTEQNISGDNNGQDWTGGIQVEIFQWFRARDFNLPPFDVANNPFNGIPNYDATGAVSAAGMPYGAEPPWTRTNPSQITADWSQYEWELDDPYVMPRHIPYDLSDWVCKTRLSTLDSGQWESLEYGWDKSLSTQMQRNLSVGWDSVMTPSQKARWGETYLSCFPVTGLTGKIIGIPSLSGTPEKGDFFPDAGHKINYSLTIASDGAKYDIWDNYPYMDSFTEHKQTSEHYTMHKTKIPLEVTIENPTAYEADACVVAYSTNLPEIQHIRREIEDFKTVIQSSPNIERGLRTDSVITETISAGLSSYGVANWSVTRGAATDALVYMETQDRFQEYKDQGLTSQSKHLETIEKRWTLEGDRNILLLSTDISSGFGPIMDICEWSHYNYYPDSFGLLSGDEILSSDEEEEEGSDSELTGGSAAHVFLKAFTMDPYSHELLYSHLSDDMPPIDYDLIDRIEGEGAPDGPYFQSYYIDNGIQNDVEYSQTSQMRIFTFFDFGKAFGLVESASENGEDSD